MFNTEADHKVSHHVSKRIIDVYSLTTASLVSFKGDGCVNLSRDQTVLVL